MSSGRPNNAGIYNFDNLNTQNLYIRGVPFKDYVDDLVAGDIFEQGEIDEIRQIIQYLNTNGLTQEWVVSNTNINAELKTALDALITKLTYLDTTALTESWVINNDNRNATLKTRIDSNDTSIGTLDTKTRYVTSVQGDDGAATASTFQVSINDRIKRQMSLSTGGNSISSINNSGTMGSTGNYNQNRILLQSPNGQVWSYAHLNTIEAIDKVEIGSAFGVGAETAVNIGARNNRINIGSIDSPEVGATTTEITIGKRTVSKNTNTTLQGNFYTPDARWESLTKSSALTWTQLLSLVSTSGLPLWVASFALTSSIPNFSYSDLWSLKAVEEAGGLIKNGELETTKGAKLKTLTVFDTEIGIDIVPKEGTFFAKGHISKTTLLGDIKMQTFNGEILLKANNISPSNINWALTEAMDNVNALKISNNDVELIAGSGADNSQLRISNTTGGPIKLRVGTGKLQSNAHDALNVLNSQATSQVQIGNAATTANRYDATTKLIVDQTQLADGIKVCKDAGSVTRINHDNITTPSINVTTLVPTAITGWNVKELAAGSGISLSSNAGVYTINSSGSGGGGSGGGTTFILTNATSVTNTSPINTLTTTYSSTAKTTITRNAYANNTTYAMGEFKSGYILGSTNLILQGTYSADLYGLLTSNQASFLYSKLYHIVERATPSTQFIVDKSLIYTTGSNSTNYQILYTNPIPVPVADISITLYQVVIPQLLTISSPNGSELITLTLRLISKNSAGTETTQYTFPTQTATIGNETADRTFIASGGVTIDMFSLTSYYFKLTITDDFTQGSVMRQALMRSDTDIVYKLAATTKTLIYNGTTNRTTLTNGVSTMYQLDMPFSFNSYDISDFTDYSKIQFEPFFIQPSGNTNNHSFVLSFQDGALSHLHTSISSAGASTLAQVLTAGNTANTSINMNSNNITNVGTIAPTAITGWNVKSINPGTGISVANSSGTVTISATTSANDSEPAMLIGAATALPTKPFWYNTQYSWLYNSSNVNTADTYYDSCVSSTGQYQILVAPDRIRSSVDWGVTWNNQNFTSFSLTGCCVTGSGNRYYLNGQYRVFYFDAIYSTFATGGNYLTSFPTLSGGTTYTKIACSQDGKHILVGVGGSYGTIYKSNDFGFTSLQVNTQGVSSLSINDVAMSADGKYQFAMFSYGGSVAIQGRVMYSSNYGVTWASPTMPASAAGNFVLSQVTCSATGQYVLVIHYTVGILISSDYGKTYIYSSGSAVPVGGCCMSANGQFQLVIATDRVWYSEDYGRTFIINSTALIGSPSTPDLITIACSSTAGYAVVGGASGRTWVIYDVPTDVRQLTAGTNITITPNGFGTYTIASSGGGGGGTELAPYYRTTVELNASGLTTITLPGTGVNLNNYDIELRINMTFANSGTVNSYTFFGIQYNGYNNGAANWTNHRHANADFVNENPNNGYASIPNNGGLPGGFYMQSFLGPYFGFMLSYDSVSSIQFLSSNITINKTNYTSTTYAPVMTKFTTTVGAVNGAPITIDSRMWTQNGMIQSGQNTGTAGFPEIRTISVSQSTVGRNQYSGVPCEFVVWLKKKL